jgi:hypothetical protein
MAANNVTGPFGYVNFAAVGEFHSPGVVPLEVWIYLVGQEKSVYFRLGEVWFIYFFTHICYFSTLFFNFIHQFSCVLRYT